MLRVVATAAVLAVAAAPGADAKRRPHGRPHAKPHRVAPPTPRIKPGRAVPFVPLTLPAAPGAPSGPGAPAGDSGSTPSAPAAPLARTLGVTTREFTLTLTRTLVGAGAVTIELRNKGEDGHDLRVDTLDGGAVAAWDELPAEAPPATKVVTLAAGTYRLYCSLPGHAAAGMDTRLTVAD